MFTVPALHLTLARRGPALVLIATGCALIGDLLGVVGRLTQRAAVSRRLGGRPDVGFDVLDLLQQTLNTAGFCLVAVSFTCFGVLFRRAGSRALGAAAMLAGVLTGIGQIPPLQPAFYLANLAFIAWYAGLIVTFRRPHGRPGRSTGAPHAVAGAR